MSSLYNANEDVLKHRASDCINLYDWITPISKSNLNTAYDVMQICIYEVIYFCYSVIKRAFLNDKIQFNKMQPSYDARAFDTADCLH